MKKILIIVIVLISGIAVLVSCKKYKDEFYGPGLGYAPDDFTASALVASNSNPDFTTGTVSFQSEFNATVRWTLTLTGQTSGAVKMIKGLSNSLNESNSVWNGTTDTTKLFQKNETVNVVLTVLGWKESISTSVTISEVRDRGKVIGAFNAITVDHGAKNWADISGLYWYYSFETNEYDLVDPIADPTCPEGSHALLISGHDANSSYYIGQVGITAPSIGAFTPGPITSVDDVYINFYLKGCGTQANKDYKFVVQLFEDDNNNGSIQYNGEEGKYTYQVSLQYDGWKLYSIKYSDLILDATVVPPADQNYNPEKIGNIGFFFGANTSVGLSATDVISPELDFVTITTNGPLIP